ncbi:unnamed protein product, partial [Leptidea sinapis]
KRYS